jgi:aryl-alcohol dehydrogenase-like predicted oxidoreductase
MEQVPFGSTGLTVSRLAFGTGSHGWDHRSEQTDLGIEGLARLLCAAYDAGVTFWDGADMYGSHPHLARALQTVPRDRVVITTKTLASTGREATRDVERFLRELHTDVLDVVLLHFLSDPAWPDSRAGAMEALSRAKEQGKVRAVGISCHSLGAMRAALASPWVEVILARINYDGVNMDGRPSEVVPLLEQLYDAGKAVYAMKVLGCGALVADPRKAIEYVLGLGVVYAQSIGMSRPEQIAQNVALMEELAGRYPLRPRRPSTGSLGA